MRFFLLYLRHHLFFLLGFFASVGIFALTFFLYRLPLSAILYPALLCAALWLALGTADYLRALSRRRVLSSLCTRVETVSAQTLPKARSIAEADDLRLILLLCDARQAEKARMQAEFADTLDYYTVWAHQIKTPISAMRLRLEAEDSARARQLKSELARIEQYVEMAMAFLRLESDSSDYVFREVELDALIKSAVRRFSSEFVDRRLALDYKGTSTRVLTDEKWLSFVLEQLLSNALKYTPSGTITIELDEGQNLYIRDTGIGIAPEDLPRIFEKGYTGRTGRQDKRASGLGLYLCARVCAALGHSLTAKSTPGAGTELCIGLSKHRTVLE